MTVNKDIHILLVDDALGIRLAAKKLLNKLGFGRVSVADDGTTALAQLKTAAVDLVIADWNMEQMSGIELLQQIKADASLAGIPFILATGEGDPARLMEAIKAGISAFINKPFEAQSLSDKIERVFEFKDQVSQRTA